MTRKSSKHCAWRTELLDSCFDLIGSVYRDIPYWRSNQGPQSRSSTTPHLTQTIWWDLIRCKQLSGGSVYHVQCLLDFLVMALQFCDTMSGIRCVGVCQTIPWFVLARNPHKGDRKWTKEERSERGQKKESAVGSRRDQSTEGGSEKMEAGQRRESTEVRKTTAKTCWHAEAGLTNARRCQHC